MTSEGQAALKHSPTPSLGSSLPAVKAHSLAILDMLRAVAAWCVVAWHLAEVLRYKMPFFASGAFAVDVFMTISGFLMMFHYILRKQKEPWASTKTWRNFLIRRFFRIAPLYYFILIGLFWFGMIRPKDLAMHLSFLFGFVPSGLTGTMMPDWSLALEMQFYLCFPLLALFVKKFGYAKLFFFACLVSAITNLLIHFYTISAPGLLGWYPQPTLLPLKLHIFALGMVMAGIYFEGAQQLRSAWFWIGFLLLLSTCKFNYTRVMATAYCAIFLLCLNPKSMECLILATRWIEARCQASQWFRWPAELSYSCYLIHIIMITLIFRNYLRYDPAGISTLDFVGWILLLLLVVNSIGWILHHVIEKPGIQLAKRLLKTNI